MVDLRSLEYPRMLYLGTGIENWQRVEDADQAAKEMADGWQLEPNMGQAIPAADASIEPEFVKRGPGRPRKL